MPFAGGTAAARTSPTRRRTDPPARRSRRTADSVLRRSDGQKSEPPAAGGDTSRCAARALRVAGLSRCLSAGRAGGVPAYAPFVIDLPCSYRYDSAPGKGLLGLTAPPSPGSSDDQSHRVPLVAAARRTSRRRQRSRFAPFAENLTDAAYDARPPAPPHAIVQPERSQKRARRAS